MIKGGLNIAFRRRRVLQCTKILDVVAVFEQFAFPFFDLASEKLFSPLLIPLLNDIQRLTFAFWQAKWTKVKLYI